MDLSVGQLAPQFSLPDQDGAIHTLSEYRGQWILLYFYPKDDTPGCTIEACSLRDNLPQFHDIHAKILGVSVDSVDSHRKFADHHHLPFTLLSDENKEVVEKYGVWEKKNMFGKEVEGTRRASFLIDPQGKITKIYPNVNPLTHTSEVLQDLKKLS